VTATAILVDDEPNVLDHLQAMLAIAWPELEIAATAHNGRAALELARDLEPDVMFLDIHMPGLSGLEVAARLQADVNVVFVTAFDQYAIAAFEAAAVDYLLKPVTSARLEATVARLKHRDQPRNHDELRALIERLVGADRPSHLQWLRAGQGETVQLVAVDDVAYFRADQKYTSVFTANGEYLIRTSIRDLAAQLDPSHFWQIHRAIIVNVRDVVKASRDLRGRYTLTLRSRPERLRSSQTFGHLFKQM
jgi:DNA-binding LytR/AlgR family response regulator